MNKTMILLNLIILAVIILLSAPLFAFDLGIHINGTAGSLTAEPYSDNYDYYERDLSTSSIGLGIILNSPIGNNILNNRLMLMFEWGTMVDDEDDSESDMSLVSLYDTLGFVLSASDRTVIWFGPQLGIRSYSVTNEADMDLNGFGLTLGAAIGSDFIVSESFNFGLEAGIRYIGGNIESSEYGNYGMDFYGPEGFIGLSAMFRI